MGKTIQTNLIDEKIIGVLKKFMIFDTLTPAEIKEILSMDAGNSDAKVYQKRIAKLVQYDRDEIVIREGDFDCWSFWVVRGAYDVIQDGQIVASFTKSGKIFGEMSVLEGIPRTASVICTSVGGGVCLCIDMSVLENMENSRIREIIRDGFYKVILTRLARTKDKMLEEKQRLEVKYAGILDFEKKIMEKAGKSE